jgi:putative transposase
MGNRSNTRSLLISKHAARKKKLRLCCKAYKFRLYPTRKQVDTLEWTLRRCKELYNAALQERREAYRMSGVSVTYRMQADQLPAIKQLREEYLDIHSQVQQDVLKRLDKAMQAFFRRVLNGETPGYPRFKSGDRYNSFTYPQCGYEIIGNRLHLSKIGYIKIKVHREVMGKIKTCTIKREGDQWFVVFSSEYEFDPSMTFHPSDEEVGIDLGVNSFAVLSDGTPIENPRFYRTAEEAIRKAHRKVHRREKGSHRHARAKQELSRLYRKVRNRRGDFLHQESRKLTRKYGALVFEDLNVVNMTKAPEPKQDEETGKYLPNGAAAKGGLNKSILDAGWSAFVTLCSYKAEEAGGKVVRISPKNTSQECSGCRKMVPKSLSVRWHSCPHCSTELDRDHNAALNILRRYREQKDGAGSVPQVSDTGHL